MCEPESYLWGESWRQAAREEPISMVQKPRTKKGPHPHYQIQEAALIEYADA